jgi:hypothetical protein
MAIGGLKGSEEHRPGVREIEVSHQLVHEIQRRPDGTTIELTRETHMTKFIMIEGRPKEQEGGGHGHRDGDKLWDDNGGGYDPVTGNPIPIDPAAVLWCPPADEFDGVVVGPRRNDLGLIEGYGPYEALETIIEASMPLDGILDLDQLFADWTLTPEGNLVAPATFEVETVEDRPGRDGQVDAAPDGEGKLQTMRVTAPNGQTRLVTLEATRTSTDAVREAFPTARNEANAIKHYREYLRSLGG